MHGFAPSNLLEIWEAGEDQHPVDRALTLLQAGQPGRTRADLAELTVTERDALLLRLRAAPPLRGGRARSGVRLGRGRRARPHAAPAAELPRPGTGMTDFLSRLAERTLGLAPVVQPLVRPLSAPVLEPPPGPVAAVEVPELAAAPLAPARKPNPLARS